MPVVGLQLPHLVFIRCTKNRSTFTPSSGSHLAISGGTASLSCSRYHASTMACLLSLVSSRPHPQEHAAVLQLD